MADATTVNHQQSSEPGVRAPERSSDVDAIVEIAIPCPLHRLFDYRWPFAEPALPGQRVSVPFGRRTITGMLVGSKAQTYIPDNKLRRVTERLDQKPILPADLMQLLDWCCRYYRHPVGEVFGTALPAQLRNGATAEIEKVEVFGATAEGRSADPASLARAPVQQALIQMLTASDGNVAAAELTSVARAWRRPMMQLVEKGFAVVDHVDELQLNAAQETCKTLNAEQQLAFDEVANSLDSYRSFLLNGVTGSGKTEVYLQLIHRVLQQNRQVLVLVPEISLTPQLLSRFRRRLNGCLICLHSAMNDKERMQNWLLAASGRADVVIGTRSAVFTPLPRLGLVVIDEEHDASLKQQEGFRYNARDLAVMRARERSVPVVMGTATPSLESLNNVESGRFTELMLTERAGGARPPQIALLDIRRRRLQEGLSDRLIDTMRTHIEAGGQVLLFINRRGFAPTLMCNDCGEPAHCSRCDSHMTAHMKINLLRCHHCGAERRLPSACEHCTSEHIDLLGCGTERIESAMADIFPGIPALRIDRDSTRRRGALQQHLAAATSGEARILIGTQMLAKGHHFPGVTLVGVLDTDRGLYGTDFRSLEQLGQLVLQVAGRAGRAEKPGQVLLQTRNPENPLLQTLVHDGYLSFAKALMQERRLAALPPYSHVCLIRAEATDARQPRAFLSQLAHALRLYSRTLSQTDAAALAWLGPVPAPMERIAGRYRAQLLMTSERRSVLNHALGSLLDQFHGSKAAQKVRWSIDVDPLDFY